MNSVDEARLLSLDKKDSRVFADSQGGHLWLPEPTNTSLGHRTNRRHSGADKKSPSFGRKAEARRNRDL